MTDLISATDLQNPEFLAQLQREIQDELCTRSYAEFVKEAWAEVDPMPLVWNWHMQIICDLLQLVSEGRIRKLLINVPPGCGKTLLTSTFWLAWDWIHNPSRYTLFATYEQGLSETHAKKQRDLVQSEWFQERWGEGTEYNVFISQDDVRKKKEFENSQKGGRISTSVGGKATGLHSNIIMFDDLSKAQDATGKAAVRGDAIKKSVEFWKGTMVTRTRKPTETIFVGVCQRLHHNDIAQHCIEEGGWVHLNLPMEAEREERCFIVEMPDGSFRSALGEEAAAELIDEGGEVYFEDDREEGELLFPERFSKEVVEKLKVALGPTAASAQLQQKPTPSEGVSLKLEWFNWYSLEATHDVLFGKEGTTIISVDTAQEVGTTNDWTVCQLWRAYQPPQRGAVMPKREFYLVDQIRLKGIYSDIIRAILELNGRYPGSKKVLIEKKSSGSTIIQVMTDLLRGTAGLLVEGFIPRDSKTQRADFVAPTIKDGRVYLPSDAKFDIKALSKEIVQFPLSKHDDQVDALTQALIYFTQNSGEATLNFLNMINNNFRI